MRRLLVGMATVTAVVMGTAAGVSAYPPEEPTVTVDNLSPIPGGPLTVTFDGCAADDTATFTLGDVSVTSEVISGVATAALTAPSAEGAATGTVECSSGPTGSFEVVVQAVPLPATGGSGFGRQAAAAGAILFLGAALTVVGQLRRRRTITA